MGVHNLHNLCTVHAIRINGQGSPELGINTAIAGYYKVPVIMLTSDSSRLGVLELIQLH